MASLRLALLLGLAVWAVPFAVGFAAYPLRESQRGLFESIMPVAVCAVVVACGLCYFRRVRSRYLREGLWLGLLWWFMCVAIDLPLMLSPPIEMSLMDYLADIGLTYAMIPMICFCIGAAAHRARLVQPDGPHPNPLA